MPDHEVFRVIGSGAYGEVWLARSMLGTMRAVKVIRRNAFDSDRPYERELRGITQFEPVSRGHEGLVDILQAGKAADGSYFYYVMELADGQGGVPAQPGPAENRESYAPRTLASDMAPGVPLDPFLCARLFQSLAAALHYMHGQGLVHRDIKPANIIFVKGEPKLADIGMVAGKDESRTWLGTDGYVPPEGSGTQEADIFSLGKVLYEAATGLDRREFPELPAAVSLQDTAMLELNSVWLRACAPAAGERYANAGAMAADLGCIVAGGSLRARGKRRRMLPAVGVLTAGVCAGAWYWWPEKKAPVMPPGAILEPQAWTAPEPEVPILVDLAREQYFAGMPDGILVAREIGTQNETLRLDVPGENALLARFITASPDGKWFAVNCQDGYQRMRRAKVGAGAWGVRQGAGAALEAMAFSHDHLRFAWASDVSSVQFHSTRNWVESRRTLQMPGQARHLAWSGNDHWLAVVTSGPAALLLIQADEFRQDRVLPLPAAPSWVEWKYGSETAAWVATEGGVFAVETTSGNVSLFAPGRATVVAADAAGHWLAATSPDGPLRVWNLRRPQSPPAEMPAGGSHLSWSANGTRLAVHGDRADSLRLFKAMEP